VVALAQDMRRQFIPSSTFNNRRIRWRKAITMSRHGVSKSLVHNSMKVEVFHDAKHASGNDVGDGLGLAARHHRSSFGDRRAVKYVFFK
jgi:hypothetical protein